MADCHSLFTDFNTKIRLTETKRERLIEVRGLLREKVDTYFFTNNHAWGRPKFQSQGSFVMDTIINPLDEDFDLDDGVYFFNMPTSVTPQAVHNEVLASLGNHTSNIQDKNTCIRVNYQEGFHIDLPMYQRQTGLLNPQLAHKTEGWIDSDPVAFIQWFEEKAGSNFESKYLTDFSQSNRDLYHNWLNEIRANDVQLRRIIRYLKAWGDLKKGEMPAGIIMTILGTENYVADPRDDIAFYKTIKSIESRFEHEGVVCKRPTTPKGEDLFISYSEDEKSYFRNALQEFTKSGKLAIENTNPRESCLEWQYHFGTRFSCSSVQNDYLNAQSFATPDVIRGNAKSG